ncbi:hypothetical protein [Cloacibacillus porcorum]
MAINMSITKLDFAAPFFKVEYLENEEKYFIKEKSLVFNFSIAEDEYIFVKTIPIYPLKGTIVENVAITQVKRALVVKDYDRDTDKPEFWASIKAAWPTLFSISGFERHKGIPYYKSPQVTVGGNRRINFCYAEPMSPSGRHQIHVPDFDEVHAQILGFGKMQKFTENDDATFYQEVIMAPGIVHDKFYDKTGYYPWHQYHSITDCIYMPIEIDR